MLHPKVLAQRGQNCQADLQLREQARSQAYTWARNLAYFRGATRQLSSSTSGENDRT